MIWWKGRGILVPIICAFVFLGTEIIAGLMYPGTRPMDNKWLFLFEITISSGLVFMASPSGENPTKNTGRVPTKGDASFGSTNEDPPHSFLSISMRSWSVALFGFAIFIFLVMAFGD